MTDDTATKPDISPAERRRRRRARIESGVVTSDPARVGEVIDQMLADVGLEPLPPPTQAELMRRQIRAILEDRAPKRGRRRTKKPASAPMKCEPPENPLRQRLKDAHLAPFEEAGAVFWATADVESDYDFTTTTEMKGDAYVITMVAKPRPRHVRVTVVHP